MQALNQILTELELQVALRHTQGEVLRIELGSSARADQALNH